MTNSVFVLCSLQLLDTIVNLVSLVQTEDEAEIFQETPAIVSFLSESAEKVND